MSAHYEGQAGSSESESVARALHGQRSGPSSWMCKRPSHADGTASLSVSSGRDGRLLVHCFAG
jgi:putative DNA primase/helicase